MIDLKATVNRSNRSRNRFLSRKPHQGFLKLARRLRCCIMSGIIAKVRHLDLPSFLPLASSTASLIQSALVDFKRGNRDVASSRGIRRLLRDPSSFRKRKKNKRGKGIITEFVDVRMDKEWYSCGWARINRN